MKYSHHPLNPDISTLISRKARKLARQPGFHRQDENDLMQDFWCHVLARLQLYDESRGCSEIGFVAMLIDRRIASMLRHRFAQRRNPKREEISLDQLMPDGDGHDVPVHKTIAARDEEVLRELRDHIDARIEGLPLKEHHEVERFLETLRTNAGRAQGRHLSDAAKRLLREVLSDLGEW